MKRQRSVNGNLCYEEQNNETPPPNLEMTRQTSEV